MKRLVELSIPLALGIGLYLMLYFSGLLTPWREPTTLASTYLKLIPDSSSIYTSTSYEVVTSVIWDQRGFDTFFETTVLFLAVLASVSVASKSLRRESRKHHTTLIPRIAARFLAPITVVVSLSVAIHGHISPGGGFQGGVVFVVAPLMIMLAFSSDWVLKHGFKETRLIALRGLALTLIAVTGLAPLVYGAATSFKTYLFQNLSKPDSPFSYLALIDLGFTRVLVSGSLILYNMLEYLAVVTGFTLVLFLLSRMFEEGETR